MNSISAQDVPERFTELLERVEAGESFTIMRGALPVAELRPIKRNPIRLGVYEGEFEITEATFAPLTGEEMKEWYGE